MTVGPGRVAFFDIGQALASVRVSDAGQRIDDLTVYPDVPAILTTLRDEGVHLGVLSDRGSIPAESVEEALDRAGPLAIFAAELILCGPKNSTRLCEQAAAATADTDEVVSDAERLIPEQASDSATVAPDSDAGRLLAQLGITGQLRDRMHRIRVGEITVDIELDH